jgi:hypothetical protein
MSTRSTSKGLLSKIRVYSRLPVGLSAEASAKAEAFGEGGFIRG